MKSSADQLGPDGNILEISLGIGLSMTRYFAFRVISFLSLFDSPILCNNLLFHLPCSRYFSLVIQFRYFLISGLVMVMVNEWY